MVPLTNQQIGICTKCLTVHVTETDFDGVHECENCGEESVYAVDTLCDMANEYLEGLRAREDGVFDD